MHLVYRVIPASKSTLYCHLPHHTQSSASVEQSDLSYTPHLPCTWQQIIDPPCPMAFGSGRLQRVTYDICYKHLQVSDTCSDPPGLSLTILLRRDSLYSSGRWTWDCALYLRYLRVEISLRVRGFCMIRYGMVGAMAAAKDASFGYTTICIQIWWGPLRSLATRGICHLTHCWW